MKIFFALILVAAALLWNQSRGQSTPAENLQPVYTNNQFKYQIDLLSGFNVDESVPELAVVSKSDERLRINAGCYDSGLENMVQSIEAVEVNGVPMLKESYYSDSILRFVRYVFTAHETCFAIELSAISRDGWQDLEKLVRSFRLN